MAHFYASFGRALFPVSHSKAEQSKAERRRLTQIELAAAEAVVQFVGVAAAECANQWREQSELSPGKIAQEKSEDNDDESKRH